MRACEAHATPLAACSGALSPRTVIVQLDGHRKSTLLEAASACAPDVEHGAAIDSPKVDVAPVAPKDLHQALHLSEGSTGMTDSWDTDLTLLVPHSYVRGPA